MSVVLSASRLTFACLAAAAALLGTAGCTGLDEANAAGVAHDDLVSELSTQLAASSGLSYTATYQLAGGRTATVTQSQKPVRTAYVYPGGRMIVTARGTIRCEADTCEEKDAAPADDHTVPGLATPESVIALLNQAAFDTTVTPTPHDTTFAGHHATCLSWPNPTASAAASGPGPASPRMTVCVTNEGALGSFAATVGGTPMEMTLTAYTDKADNSAFTLPKSFHLTDHRTAK